MKMKKDLISKDSSLNDQNEIQQQKKADIENSISKDIDAVNVEITGTKFFLVILALIISLIMSSLDISIVSTALPAISNQFNSKDECTWVITAYMLGNTSFQIMFGKLSDIFGRRPIMIFSLILFVTASTICGAAPGMKMLIIARGFQGMAGGGILSMTNIIIADIVPLRQRGIYMGIVGAIFSISSVIGPLLGGFLTDKFGWRWIFFINIPIGVVAIIVILIVIRIPTPHGTFKEKFKKIDFLGTTFLVLFVVPLLLGLSWGGTKYSWTSLNINSLIIGSIICLIIYVLIEWKFAIEPLTPFQMFKNRNVGLSCIINFFLGIVFLGYVNTIALLYQDGRGYSAIMCGARLTPMSISISVGNIGSGYFVGKYGYIERYMRIGAFILIISVYLLTLFDIGFPYIYEFFILNAYGISLGLVMQNTVLVTQQSAPKKFLAISTTINNFFRLIGGSLGVTLISMITTNKFPKYYKEVYPNTEVTVNDIHKITDGEVYYTKSMLFSYLVTLIPSTIIIFILTLLYGFVPTIGNRKKEIKMKEKKLHLKEMEAKQNEIKVNIEDSGDISTIDRTKMKETTDHSINDKKDRIEINSKKDTSSNVITKEK